VTENEIGDAIIAAAMKVHSVTGPGLLESAYETCLAYELEKRNLPVRRQASIPIRYQGLTIDNGYRVDIGASSLAISSTFTSRICATALSGWSMHSDSQRPLRYPPRPLR
jgi:hypothetical protein